MVETTGGTSADYLYAAESTKDAGFILAGLSYSNASGDKSEDNQGWIDYWVVKLAFDNATILTPPAVNNNVKCFPDPATDYLMIQLESNSPHTISIFNEPGKIFL